MADAVIEVAGIGYRVVMGSQSLSKLKISGEVLVHTAQIFREDSVTLYGFVDPAELELFNLLGTVNGVGPKSALTIVNQLGVDGITQAVTSADDGAFKSVSGVGPKTAKLIILSLTGKLIVGSESSSPGSSTLVQALVNLGYQEKVARLAIESVLKENASLSESDSLKRALTFLAQSKSGK
jgi:Holliday junction DNA helicase RuvA